MISVSFTLSVNSTMVITIIVSAWTVSWARPSWSSCWRFSMSEVIRVMITPAFSSV